MGADTISIQSPVADQGLSGTINISGVLDSNTANITMANFSYRLDGTQNWVMIGINITNETANTFNITFDTTTIVDQRNWTLNITTFDGASGTITSDVVLTVHTSNGVPTATWSSASITNNTHIVPDETFTMGLDADATIGIENCTFYVSTQTSSVSGVAEACSTTFNIDTNYPNFPQNTLYDILITAIDSNGNETNSSTRSFYLDPRPVGGGVTTTPQAEIEDEVEDGIPTEEKENIISRIGTSISNSFNSIINWFKNLSFKNLFRRG